MYPGNNTVIAMAKVDTGVLRENEPMARHCSWRCGGNARYYLEPDSTEKLAEVIASLDPQTDVYWIGLGSNLLVREGGYPGLVVCALKTMNRIRLLENGHVFAECGATTASLARFCERSGFTDAAFLGGIPGTVGGALAMNAGAFGGETWNHVVQVETVNRQGDCQMRDAADYQVGYRHVVQQPNEWFSGAEFRFSRNPDKRINIRSLLDKRNASQPIGEASCGSVFKNPPHDHAARLIEASGLKGQCIGGACVSNKHANFIINNGQATATDIEAMIQRVQQQVRQKFGVVLETEVKIIGESL